MSRRSPKKNKQKDYLWAGIRPNWTGGRKMSGGVSRDAGRQQNLLGEGEMDWGIPGCRSEVMPSVKKKTMTAAGLGKIIPLFTQLIA